MPNLCQWHKMILKCCKKEQTKIGNLPEKMGKTKVVQKWEKPHTHTPSLVCPHRELCWIFILYLPGSQAADRKQQWELSCSQQRRMGRAFLEWSVDVMKIRQCENECTRPSILSTIYFSNMKPSCNETFSAGCVSIYCFYYAIITFTIWNERYLNKVL